MACFTSIASFLSPFGRICLRFARLVTSWRRAEPDDANNASISPTLEMPMLQTWLHLDTRCSEMQAHTPASRCGCTALRPHSRLHLDAHLHCVYSGAEGEDHQQLSEEGDIRARMPPRIGSVALRAVMSLLLRYFMPEWISIYKYVPYLG